MKTFIRIDTVYGDDFHDTYRVARYLKENSSFEISDPVDAIVNCILNEFMDFSDAMFKNADVDKIATTEAIREAIEKREGNLILFEATCKSDVIGPYRLAYTLDAKNLHVSRDSYYCCEYYFTIQEIEDVNVRYCVIESFLSPCEGCEAIDRLYNYPVKTEEEAEALLNNLKLHEDESSVKTILIDDVDNLIKSGWYAYQTTAISLIEDITSINRSIEENRNRKKLLKTPFSPFVETHIKLLQDVIDRYYKAA